MNKKYAQCEMHRKNSSTTSYIPAKFAKIGNVVKLKNDGEWTDGWIIHSVGELVEFSDLPDYRKAIRAHRKSTGDSLKK